MVEGLHGVGPWIEAYHRCMDGEFFIGASCPRDGSSSIGSRSLAEAVISIRNTGSEIDFPALVSHGFAGSLSDVWIVHFPTSEGVPQWLAPLGEPQEQW